MLLNLPQDTFQEVQKIAQAGTPGVSSVKIAEEMKVPQMKNLYRELEVEAGFVCKKCRMAYHSETTLLAHQRNICYPGKLSESRGAIRLVALHYECKLCTPGHVTSSLSEFKRHCESCKGIQQNQQQNQQSQQAQQNQLRLLKRTPPSPSSGLTHEMENVVNQITALAAQAAQENANPPSLQDSNANFTLKNCQQEPGKLGLNPIGPIGPHVPIHSSGH